MAFSSTTVSVGDPTEKADYDRLMDNTIFLYSSTLTFTGEKTFQSSTVFVAAPTFQAQPNKNVTIYGVSGTTTVENYFETVQEIGDWDMSADAAVTIALRSGLSVGDVRLVRAVIRNDANSKIDTFMNCGANHIIYMYTTSSGVRIERTSTYFGSSLYDSTGYNRGWIFITHV